MSQNVDKCIDEVAIIASISNPSDEGNAKLIGKMYENLFNKFPLNELVKLLEQIELSENTKEYLVGVLVDNIDKIVDLKSKKDSIKIDVAQTIKKADEPKVAEKAKLEPVKYIPTESWADAPMDNWDNLDKQIEHKSVVSENSETQQTKFNSRPKSLNGVWTNVSVKKLFPMNSPMNNGYPSSVRKYVQRVVNYPRPLMVKKPFFQIDFNKTSEYKFFEIQVPTGFKDKFLPKEVDQVYPVNWDTLPGDGGQKWLKSAYRSNTRHMYDENDQVWYHQINVDGSWIDASYEEYAAFIKSTRFNKK